MAQNLGQVVQCSQFVHLLHVVSSIILVFMSQGVKWESNHGLSISNGFMINVICKLSAVLL